MRGRFVVTDSDGHIANTALDLVPVVGRSKTKAHFHRQLSGEETLGWVIGGGVVGGRVVSGGLSENVAQASSCSHWHSWLDKLS